MTRWKAAGIHLSISMLAGGIAFCLLYFVYYPQPYFAAAGAGALVLILLGVDVVLGPLLTLVVFKSGKKTLKFDLSTIGLIQAAALVYGLHIMWIARPIFVVASVDRFELVYAGDITAEAFAAAQIRQYSTPSLTGPVLVLTRRPKPGAENSEVMEITLSGSDTQFHPKYFVAPTSALLAKFWQRSMKIEDLPEPAQSALRHYIKANNVSGRLAAVPMKGRTDDYTVLVNIDTNQIIASFQASAWR